MDQPRPERLSLFYEPVGVGVEDGHDAAPGEDANLQIRQAVDPKLFVNFPAGQAMQADAPVLAENVPVAQG